MEDVYKAIDSERAYHIRNAKDKDWNHKDRPTIGHEILLMEEYLLKARQMWTSTNDPAPVLDILRKISGMTVRCFENHGVPSRS